MESYRNTLSGAYVKIGRDDYDTEVFWVVAYCSRFGDELIVGEFGFDEGSPFYRERAEALAEALVSLINSQP